MDVDLSSMYAAITNTTLDCRWTSCRPNIRYAGLYLLFVRQQHDGLAIVRKGIMDRRNRLFCLFHSVFYYDFWSFNWGGDETALSRRSQTRRSTRCNFYYYFLHSVAEHRFEPLYVSFCEQLQNIRSGLRRISAPIRKAE